MATIQGNNFGQHYSSFWHIDFSLYGTNEQDVIYGWGGDDALYGLDGNDYLDGGTGPDFMNGGWGNDTYVVDNVGDVVFDDVDLFHADGTPVNAGRDRVQSSITYTLGARIEELELLDEGVDIDGIGNSLDNKIIGNSTDNFIDGRAGADTMRGREGNDTYLVDNVGDIVTELTASGEDDVFVFNVTSYTLPTNVENLNLASGARNGFGNSLTNEITGNDESNTIAGSLGNDILTGLAGADTFVFNTEPDRNSNFDTITDFTPGVDKIRLDSRIFDELITPTRTSQSSFLTTPSNPLSSAEFATFTVGDPAQDASDRIIYNSPLGILFYDPDGTGPQASVAFADLNGGLNLTANDFLVI